MKFYQVITLKKRPTGIVLSLFGLFLLMTVGVIFQEPQEQPVLSYALANLVIVVDAGHGGVDPGAIGPGQVLEKDITLAISKKLADQLSQAGALVIPTRMYDDDLAGDEFTGTIRQRKQEDMLSRVELAKKNNADIFISIHANAETSRKWTGAQVFYESGDQESKGMARGIQQALKEELKNTQRSATAGNYYIMKKTEMPTVLIEVGFISNPNEERLLLNEEYQSRLAHAIFSGMVQSQVDKNMLQP